jgi:hypothetical protein
MQSGHVEEGGRLIEIAIALDAKSGLALHNLSLSKKFEPGDEIISEMEAFARNASPRDVDDRIYVHFALEFHRSERSVRTASFAQVRRPLYPTSVGRWRSYEPFLGPLVAALGPDEDSGAAS